MGLWVAQAAALQREKDLSYNVGVTANGLYFVRRSKASFSFSERAGGPQVFWLTFSFHDRTHLDEIKRAGQDFVREKFAAVFQNIGDQQENTGSFVERLRLKAQSVNALSVNSGALREAAVSI